MVVVVMYTTRSLCSVSVGKIKRVYRTYCNGENTNERNFFFISAHYHLFSKLKNWTDTKYRDVVAYLTGL